MLRRSLWRGVCFPNKSNVARRCFTSGNPGHQSPAPTPNKQAAVRGRFDRFVERTPRFLRPAVTGLQKAPFSHVAAFFILHELTAAIPLLGLAGAFHYWHWLPPYFAEAAWISNGIEKFGRYFRKKGWITEQEETEVENEAKQGNARQFEEQRNAASKWLKQKENATRWVVELATAYAIVKVLLPVRIFVSVWGAPWFARLAIIPITRLLGLLRMRLVKISLHVFLILIVALHSCLV